MRLSGPMDLPKMAGAFALPFGNPAYPPAPDKFFDRPALTVRYRTDPDKARALVREPLVLEEPVVSLTFLFMVAPGLGDYYEISQSLPAFLNGESLSFRPSMYASSVAAILDGRESGDFPRNSVHRCSPSRTTPYWARWNTAVAWLPERPWDTSIAR